MSATVRGEKIGTFQGKAFYVLPGNRCRLGSKGRVEDISTFASGLTDEGRAELHRIAASHEIGKFLGDEPVAPQPTVSYETRPETPLASAKLGINLGELNGSSLLLAGNQLTGLGRSLPVAEFYGSLPKGDARRVRKMLRAAGYNALAGLAAATPKGAVQAA